MRSVAGPSIKLAIFATVTVLLTGVLAATIANTGFGATSTYTAVFTDASGLAEGDDVRIRGVKVGRVASLEVLDDHLAAVDLEVETGRRLPAGVTATVKYRNIIGQRYVALGELTGTTAGLLGEARPALREDIAALGDLSGNLAAESPEVDRVLRELAPKLEALSRTVSYGSWFNFYLCVIDGEVTVDSLSVAVPFVPAPTTSMPERCGP
jgi:ABC-type transporter Mla subunit MlaD